MEPPGSVHARRRLAWAVALAATSAVWVVSVLPPFRGLAGGAPGGDKGGHFVAYFLVILSWLPVALGARDGRAARRRVAGSFVAVVLCGAAIELVQEFVGRTASVWDGLANLGGGASLGGLIGLAAVSCVHRRANGPAVSDAVSPGEPRRGVRAGERV